MTEVSSPGSFASYQIALEYKQAMESIVSEVLDNQRPAGRYAKVVNVDYLNAKCEVLYPGEPSTNVVNLNTTRPIAAGQWVRIEGVVGDKRVVDVQDGRQHTQGEFLFSEPFIDPDSAQDILASMDSGVLSLVGQSSGKTLASFDEGTGVVKIPGFDNVAAGVYRIVNDQYITSTGVTIVASSTEVMWGQTTFVAQAGHRYRYYAKAFFSPSSATATTWFKRIRYNSDTTVGTGNSAIYVDQHYSPNNLGNYVEYSIPLPRTLAAGQTYTVGASLQLASGSGTNSRSVDDTRPLIVQLIDDGT